MSDITELFQRDPLSLTTEDIDQIIARYREARTQFNMGNVKAGKLDNKTSMALEKAKQMKLDIDL